jgi:hypothetical protein
MAQYYQGKFAPKNPEKYMGDAKNIIYRSSWELKLMTRLDLDPGVVRWASEEFAIPYFDPVESKTRRYFPDFFVENVHGQKYVLEIKPLAQTKPPPKRTKQTKRYITEVHTFIINNSKWTSAEKFCKERGWEFKLVTEKELGI